MTSFFKKLPMNIFTLLIAVAAIAFAFRAVDTIGTIARANAQQQVNEQPPPLTAAEMEQAVRDTARNPALPSADTAQIAQAPADEKPPADLRLPSSPVTVPADTSTASDQRIFSSAEIEVLQALSRRRDEIDKREQKLSAREALLNAAEQEVDRKIAELNKLRGEIEALLGKQQTMEEERLTSLVKIYENMKPKEAAAIFNTLDMDILLSVISRMSERKSSPVLASMDTDRARLVTIRLAELRKLPEAPKKPATPAGR